MDPRWPRGAPESCGLPRTRGDGPEFIVTGVMLGVASPHTRGWTPRRARGVDGKCGFPAHAGMDLSVGGALVTVTGLPRTRGDGPSWMPIGRFPPVASPHTRGWTPCRWTPPTSGRGFPAHAGMDPRRPPGRSRGRWLPRTRGDGPRTRGCPSRVPRASPHTRGWTRRRKKRVRQSYGFPAHAGMDPIIGRLEGTGGGLPRTRGDGP